MIMTPKIKKLYDNGIKDEKFLKAIKEADNDRKPGMFANNTEKCVFTATYYGYLVGAKQYTP